MDEQPTAKQIRLIQSWRIPVPGTKNEATILIDYILQGNGSRGNTVRERVRIARRYFNAWHRMAVKIVKQRHRWRSSEGVVVGLRARTQKQVGIAAKTCRDQAPHPFEALVCLKPHNRVASIALSSLTVTGPGNQKRLFE